MFVQVPMHTRYGKIMRVEVSVRHVAAPITDGGKYYVESSASRCHRAPALTPGTNSVSN
jgi:hypothetical protein